jgi:hypothetical protein
MTQRTARLKAVGPLPEHIAPGLPAETIPRPEIRAVLRRHMDGLGLAADLALAPIDNLFDHARSVPRFVRGPALYYANHRTGYESSLFAFLHAAVSGGLPAAPVGYKFHLPYRMGEPIAPETLAALPSLAGRRRILGAINAMAPDEGVYAGVYAGRANFGLARRCLRRHMETGSSALKCFLLEAIETMPDPSPESQLLKWFIRSGVLPAQGVADAAWFARKAMWLTDGRALRTVAEPARG